MQHYTQFISKDVFVMKPLLLQGIETKAEYL